MIVRKITEGYVIQEYDTRKKRWVSQEFAAGWMDAYFASSMYEARNYVRQCMEEV